jgi:hypothetical protein
MLYPAARKATWGGLWPAGEEPYLRLPRDGGAGDEGMGGAFGNTEWVLSEETGGEEGLAKWFRQRGLSKDDATRAAAAAAQAYAEENGFSDDDDDDDQLSTEEVDKERVQGKGVAIPGKGAQGGNGWLDVDAQGGGGGDDDDDESLGDEVDAFLKRVSSPDDAQATRSDDDAAPTVFGVVVEDEDDDEFRLPSPEGGGFEVDGAAIHSLGDGGGSTYSRASGGEVKEPAHPRRAGRRRRLSRLLGRRNNKTESEDGKSE